MNRKAIAHIDDRTGAIVVFIRLNEAKLSRFGTVLRINYPVMREIVRAWDRHRYRVVRDARFTVEMTHVRR